MAGHLCGARRRDRAVTLLAAVLLLVGGAAAVLIGPSAQARGNAADSGPVYPLGASVTQFQGLAFDTCETPTLATMDAWRSSEYRAIGVYLSGENRGCKQNNLSADWVARVSSWGWRLLPIDLGLQAPCRDNSRKKPIQVERARSQGATEADHAVSAAQALGLRPGSAIYADMESYRVGAPDCARAVGQYLSGWSSGLHRHGYLSGMYGNLNSGVADAAARYASPDYTRIDAVWVGHWDGTTRMTGWRGVGDNRWPGHQRAKQFRGDHVETHGGVTMKIDSDYLDAPVATVAPLFQITGRRPVAHHAPNLASPRAGSLPTGGIAHVVCQIRARDGQVWDELTAGSWLVDQELAAGVAKLLPDCAYPQSVIAPAGAVARMGPGFGNRAGGTLPLGALAWVSCRDIARPGWLRLPDGFWVDADNLGAGARATRALPICA
ncbi:MAG TPA: DUF1906 domain-containing protein [Sporichthyaceae bacterium]|jgi:hypothetical protein|nr:DUF1906 domain-containing protein [Sporichthyaceae bacterium]